jgi:hypothetical protein
MGFNKRKMEDRRREAVEKEAAARRATERQILEDADHLIAVWNERQAKRMPMLFSRPSAPPSPPAIGFCGRAARLAVPRAMSTCGRSTGTAARPRRRLHRRCRVDRAGRTHRSLNWCVCRSRALPRSITRSEAAIGG